MPIAFVLINTEPASMPEVNKAISDVEGVEQADMVYGVYDIVAKVKVETMGELKQIIACKIRKIKNVLTTQTILVVDKKARRVVFTHHLLVLEKSKEVFL